MYFIKNLYTPIILLGFHNFTPNTLLGYSHYKE
nr:MAG TPA: hypothetical protein [Caudoviricetes sp.]